MQINKIRNEKGEITTDTIEIQRIIKDYYKQLYANKMDNHKEIDGVLTANYSAQSYFSPERHPLISGSLK